MSAAHHLNPNQLKMFMSAHEITSQYEILDGDRYRNEFESSEDSRAGRYTYRSHRTDGLPNNPTYGSSGDMPYRRPQLYEDRPETDDEVWDRKLDEAWDEGLRHDIMENGVESPVHLGVWGTRGQPRPTIVGGHHRLAVMRSEAPDELMPVLHHEDLWSAKLGIMNGKYPYS